jgi:O-methyltransferase
VYPDFTREFVDAYSVAMAHTMTSPERMYALWQAASHVEAIWVPGAIVQCGVWRGGSTMIAALALRRTGSTTRELWLYDTFSGMPDPTDTDVDFLGRPAAGQMASSADDPNDLVIAHASLEEVKSNLARTGYPEHRLRYVPGRRRHHSVGGARTDLAPSPRYGLGVFDSPRTPTPLAAP